MNNMVDDSDNICLDLWYNISAFVMPSKKDEAAYVFLKTFMDSEIELDTVYLADNDKNLANAIEQFNQSNDNYEEDDDYYDYELNLNE